MIPFGAKCGECPLAVDGEAQFPVPGHGPSKASLVVVGEAPGKDEVARGTPFVGPSGRLLDATLKDVGGSRGETFVTNTTLCRPPVGTDGKDVPPPVQAVRACHGRLLAEVTQREPKVVMPVGNAAAQAILHTQQGITKIAGVMEWSTELHSWVLPTYHPAAVLHGATGYFDDIYVTVRRGVAMSQGRLHLPEREYKVDWEFIGHRGERIPRGKYWTWSGFWETNDEEVERARDVLHDMMLVSTGPVEWGLDTESRSPRYHDPMTMLQVSMLDRTYAFTWAVINHERVRPEVQRLLSNPRITWDIHNEAYDRQVIRHWLDVELRDNTVDVMAKGLCLTERGEQVGLKFMSRQYLNAPYYEKDLDEWLPGADAPFDCVPPDILAKYGCLDAFNVRSLARIVPAVVSEEGGDELYERVLLPAQRAFAQWEYDGTLIDRDYAASLEAEWVPMIEEAVGKVQEYASAQGYPKDPKVVSAQTMGIACPECVTPNEQAQACVTQSQTSRTTWRSLLASTAFGDPSCKRCMKRRFVLVPDPRLNVRSYPQMQHLAFDMLRMPMGPDGRSCNEAFWERNASHPLSLLVGEYREADHLLRNYVRGIGDDIGPDGRIHPDFLLYGTVTGRLAIHNPPLQTIPKWGVSPDKAKLIRKMFKATPCDFHREVPYDSVAERLGFDDLVSPATCPDCMVIVDVDYSNLELFIAHHYSDDANLLKALTEQDFHRATASAIFDKPYEAVTGADRFNSKFVTFGIAYGRQAWSLAQGELKPLTGGDERKAQLYIDRFWELYPGYAERYFGWQNAALDEGVIRTPLGRMRHWRLIMPNMVQAIKNQAVNFPIQSLASDTCLSAGIRLTPVLRERGWGRVLFTVHDSLVFEIRRRHLEAAIMKITYEMVHPPYESTTPFRTDVEVGTTLGEVKPWTGPTWTWGMEAVA